MKFSCVFFLLLLKLLEPHLGNRCEIGGHEENLFSFRNFIILALRIRSLSDFGLIFALLWYKDSASCGYSLSKTHLWKESPYPIK